MNETGLDQRGLSNNFWETIVPVKVIKKRIGTIIIPSLGNFMFNSYGIPFAVASFNYALCNNLTLPNIPNPGNLGFNFNLAVRYNNPTTGIPVRYKFWNFDTNPAKDCPAPIYEGQPILGANFAIEIWSQSGQPSLVMLGAIILNTSILMDRCLLTDCDTFELPVPTECSSLTSTNGLNLPLQFSACACVTGPGTQVGTNYMYNVTTGMLELLNLTTGNYNPIYASGAAGHEYIIIGKQTCPNIGTYTACIPTQGANYRISSSTGEIELLNLTTGLYNPLNTIGQPGVESIVLQPQTSN